VVTDGADLPRKENSKLDQAIVLATSEDAPPSIVPQGVKFLSLVEGLNPPAPFGLLLEHMSIDFTSR